MLSIANLFLFTYVDYFNNIENISLFISAILIIICTQ